MSKTFIVPVGAAVAALLSGVGDEAKAHVDTAKESSPRQESTNTYGEVKDAVLQRVIYQLNQQAHTILLQKSASGILYAGHGSHASHGSHGSHRSHRSGH